MMQLETNTNSTQVLESTLVGLKMVDEHRKGGDGRKFKFIDIFSSFSPRRNVTEDKIEEEEEFEVG